MNGETKSFTNADEAFAYGDELFAKYGTRPAFEKVASVVVAAPAPVVDPLIDDAGKARVEAQHAALATAGVKVDTSEQLYKTGTKLLDVGVSTQASRKAEHDAKSSVAEATDRLRTTVLAEKREDVIVSAGEIAKSVKVNGFASVMGLKLTEQAIRGLTTRLGSSALGHILGLRNRIAGEMGLPEGERNMKLVLSDKEEIARILRHECERFADTKLRLRTRTGSRQDVYAILSPTYAPADAPEVLDQLVNGLPSDTKASFAYDPASTQWELRAEVFTPTPAEKQVVGEAFEGYLSFSSRDDGTSRFNGGGGVNLIRCRNATTYTAEGIGVSRVHRGAILLDIEELVSKSGKCLHSLIAAWGQAREAVVEVPSGLTIEDAIPGFWRHVLTDRRSELAGVLRGRTEEHVKGLTLAYFGERRDPEQVKRADFAQGWTKYIQGQESATRRVAEAAVGDWIVNNSRPITYLAED